MPRESSPRSVVCAYPPRWHTWGLIVATTTGVAVSLWSALGNDLVGALIVASLCPLFAYGAVSTLTTRIWISGDRVFLRDRVSRVRSYGFGEITSITYVPDELFRFRLESGRSCGFPAGSRNLAEFADALALCVAGVRDVELRGVLGRLVIEEEARQGKDS